MSYMRFPHYVYACSCNEVDHISIDGTVEMPMENFDELVAMRAAQLVEAGLFEAAEYRAMEMHGGNLGCDALLRKYGRPTALGPEFIDALKQIREEK